MSAGPAKPRVSVLLSSRNGERFLEQALASLAAQTWQDFEVIAVDDGSTDRTREMLHAFANAHARTHVLRTEGIGLAAALHMAAQRASAGLLARQDDDDVSDRERFERQVAYLDAHPEVEVLGTRVEMIDGAGASLGQYPVETQPGALRARLAKAPPFVHGSVMMRAGAYRAAGGYRPAFQAAQDYDLWLRFPASATFANLPQSLYRWRLHGDAVFAKRRDDQIFYAALARTFAQERLATGSDSIALLDHAVSRDEFLHDYARAGTLLSAVGEALVRECRTPDARRVLARAFARGGSRAHAAVWWAASWIAGAFPRRGAAHAAMRKTGVRGGART